MADIEFDRVTHYAIYTRSGIYNKNYVVVKTGTDGSDNTEGIESDTLLLSEILIDDEFKIGQVNSNRFEVTLHGLQADVSGCEIEVWQTPKDDYTDKTPLFVGFIDSCIYDKKSNSREIVAYDFTYKFANYDVAATLANVISGVIEDYDILEDKTYGFIFSSLYYSVSASDTFNYLIYPYPYVSISTPPFLGTTPTIDELKDVLNNIPKIGNVYSGLRFIDFLTIVGEACNCFINVDRNGYLEYVEIKTATAQIRSHELLNTDYQNDSEIEENILPVPEVLTITDKTGTIIAQKTMHDIDPDQPEIDPSKSYRIYTINNIFVTAYIKYHNQYGDFDIAELYFLLLQKHNVPAKINLIVSDADIKLGDSIWLYDEGVVGLSACVFQNTLFGSLLVEQTIECNYGDMFADNTVPEEKKQIEELYNNTNDSGWEDISDTLSDDFVLQASASGMLRARRIGAIVFVEGVISPVNALPFTSDVTMFTLPQKFRPLKSVYSTFTNGANNNVITWNMKITLDGKANINLMKSSGTATQFAAGSWISFNVSYAI